jgi:MMP 1-O-methyltransferase
MGRSTCWLAAGSKSVGREPVFAVDHFKGSPGHQAKGTHELHELAQNSTYSEFEANLKANNLMDWVRPRIGSSTEVAANWSGPIRLLFIDGDHSYHSSKNDFDSWSRFVPVSGLVALHDIDVWPGVTQFYNELVAMTGWRVQMRALSLCVLQRIAVSRG